MKHRSTILRRAEEEKRNESTVDRDAGQGAPRVNDWREGFFPRKTYYKREAEALRAEVERGGGIATVARETKETK